MMSGCPLSYFTRTTWKVMDPPTPKGETKDHIVKIADLGNNSVEIACLTDPVKHGPYRGKYNPDIGRIEGTTEEPSVPSWYIEGLPDLAQIRCLLIISPDGWTANDSGALSGGE
jgi:hypothetical protein